MRLKRFLAFVVAFAMVMSVMPAMSLTAFAEEATVSTKTVSTADDLITALEADGEVVLGDNISVSGTITVHAGVTVTLDLAGHTITGTPAVAEAYSVIVNNGNLTITDSSADAVGKIVCNYTHAYSTSYAVSTITNSGSLTVKAGTIENKSTANNQIGYAIDNNSTSGNAVVVIDGGNITASGSNNYDGIRQFCNSTEYENSVTINGGSVSSLWLQNPSDGADAKNTENVKGSFAVTGGSINAIYLEPSTAFAASITGGTIGNVSYFAKDTDTTRNLTGFISGGTFTEKVNDDFCVSGLTLTGSEAPYTVAFKNTGDSEEDPYIITDTAAFKWFRDSVNAGNEYADKYIKLEADVDLSGEDWEPIGSYHSGGDKHYFKGTFDGGEKTISNMTIASHESTWDYTGHYEGLFGYVDGAAIKNLKVDKACIESCDYSGIVAAAASGDCTFESIEVKNSTIYVYNATSAGVVGYTTGSSDKKSEIKFSNITVDETNTIGALWDTYDSCVGGILGWTYSNCDVTLDNCSVAAKLDVFNDVASNYQWWQYRRCGMLIGFLSDETNYKTLDQTADTSSTIKVGSISAKFTNCTVAYDIWNQYKYCEFESAGKGSYNAYDEYKFLRTDKKQCIKNDVVNGVEHKEYESCSVIIAFNQLWNQGNYYTGFTPVRACKGVTVIDNNQADAVNANTGVEYDSLQDAVNNVNDGDTIVLAGDIDLTETLVIPGAVTTFSLSSSASEGITLNLLGNSITGSDLDSDSALIENYGTLTVIDSVGSGSISSSSSSAIKNAAGSSLTLNGGSVTGSEKAIVVDDATSGGSVTVTSRSSVTGGMYLMGAGSADASSVTLSVDDGSVDDVVYSSLTETPVTINLSDGSYTIDEAGKYIVVADSATTNTLTIKADATVTLSGITVNAGADTSAVSIESGKAALVIDGEVNLTGGDNGAGIYVAETASVTITDTGADDDKLTATGNAGVDDASGAAGIGGTWANGNSGAVTIDGAKVVANGYGVHGSGIGSGSGKVVGEIKIINGADVTAQGGYYADGAGTLLQSSYGKSDPEGGAGIGGGGKTASTIADITIEGSTVTANGGSKAAGIGANFWCSCGEITITNSTVTAQGGSSSAGIGTSRAGDSGVSASITLTNSIVTAKGGAYGAGIGAGYNADSLGNGASESALPETAIVIDGGTITATGGEGGAGIGGGYKSDNVNIDITGDADVTAAAGALVSGKTIENGGAASAIGTGANGSGTFENTPAVEIDTTATVEATSYYGGKSAIAGYTNEEAEAMTNVTVNASVTGLSGSGTEEDPYLISNLAELKWFRDDVNTYTSDGSNQYKGKYVKLTADIDLDGENWTPIGTNSVGDHMAFLGTFDGGNHTISNLYVNKNSNYAGFFAIVGSYEEGITPTVKNITFNNVNVSSGNGNYAGGVVADAPGSTVFENVHVTGTLNVSGRGYIGGIIGHGYPEIKDCSVKAEGTISSTFWCAGGVIGYMGEGSSVENTSVEGTGTTGIVIKSAAGGLGSVAGMAEDNDGTQPCSAENLSAKNIQIQTYVGGYGTSYAEYALGYLVGGSQVTKFTGTNIAENVTFSCANGTTNPSVDDAVATIDNTVYFDLQSAVNAAEDDETVTVLRNVTLGETVIVPAGKTIALDLNEKTISVAASMNSTPAFRVLGNVTVSNGTVDATAGTYTYAFIVGNGTTEGSLTITDGTYKGVTSAASVTYGTLTIEGGTFSATEYDGAYEFTLNCIDTNYKNGIAKVVVKGGTFYKFDPSNNAAEGANTSFVAEGYTAVDNGDDTFTVYEIPELPTATVTEIKNDDLTFALNFKADEVTEEQLACYGDWYADFELTLNKDVTFNANGGADGYLSGQYDEWNENWVNVPFEDVKLTANTPLKIMEYAAEMMGEKGLKVTYNDVYTSVKDFDCGVFFTPEFLAANPDLEVTLELRMYNPEDETESYTIGKTYTFNFVAVATVTSEDGKTVKAYATLQEAVSEAEDGDTVKLLANVTDNIKIDSAKKISLVTGNYTYTGAVTLEETGAWLIADTAIENVTSTVDGVPAVKGVNDDNTKYGYVALPTGLNMAMGAQVRIGGGVDENNEVIPENSGIRFITTVNGTDTLFADADTYKGEDKKYASYMVGVDVTADGSKEVVNVPAEKWQGDGITYTTAITNLAVSNYVRPYTATAYVYVDGIKYSNPTSVTRSIYQVAAGLLAEANPEDSAALVKVLNAYANQTGIRLVVSDGELKANTNYTTNGAYKLDEDELHFVVSDAKYDPSTNSYSVVLTAKGNAEIYTEDGFVQKYVRINNNNSMVKSNVTVEKVEGKDNAVKLTFTAGDLIDARYPDEEADGKITDPAGDDSFDEETPFN